MLNVVELMIKSAVNRMNASVVQRAGVSGTCREGEQPLKTIISHQPLIRIGMKRIKSQSKFQESFYFKKGIHCFPRQCSHVTSPVDLLLSETTLKTDSRCCRIDF